MRRWWVLALAMLAACGSAADHERLGDDAVASGDLTLALAEYRAAGQGPLKPRLLAKLGTAALQAEAWPEAVEAFRSLGAADPSRAVQAATGLELAARGALASGDMAALRDAALTLRTVAPERLDGQAALALVQSETLAPDEEITLLPYALAAAPGAAVVDSLLARYGDAYRRTAACEDAVRIYRTLARRPGVDRQAVADGLARCALTLGRDADELNRPGDAEHWYRVASRAGPESPAGRAALLGLADVRAALGDTVEASTALETAIRQGSPADSLSQVALQRLTALGLGAASTRDLQP